MSPPPAMPDVEGATVRPVRKRTLEGCADQWQDLRVGLNPLSGRQVVPRCSQVGPDVPRAAVGLAAEEPVSKVADAFEAVLGLRTSIVSCMGRGHGSRARCQGSRGGCPPSAVFSRSAGQQVRFCCSAAPVRPSGSAATPPMPPGRASGTPAGRRLHVLPRAGSGHARSASNSARESKNCVSRSSCFPVRALRSPWRRPQNDD